MSDPTLRDRLIEACQPLGLKPLGNGLAPRPREEIAAAALAVIVDALRNPPNDDIVQVVGDALETASDGSPPYVTNAMIYAVLSDLADYLAGGSDD